MIEVVFAGGARRTPSDLRNESTLHFSPDSSTTGCRLETGSFGVHGCEPADRTAHEQQTAQTSLALESQVVGSSEMTKLMHSSPDFRAHKNDGVEGWAVGDGECDHTDEVIWASLDVAIDILTSSNNAAEDGKLMQSVVSSTACSLIGRVGQMN